MNIDLKQVFNNTLLYIKNNLIQILILVIGSLIIGLIATKLYYGNKIDKLITENEVYVLREKLNKQTIEEIKNSTGKIIQKQEVVITNNQDAINQLSLENFQLKKKDEKNLNTIALLRTKTEFNINNITIPYKDSTISVSVKNKDSLELINYIQDSTLKVPIKISFTDTPDIEFYQTITKQNIILDSLKIQDSSYQRIVENTNGIFKKSTYEIQSFHTNKYIKDVSKQSLLFIPKQKNRLKEYVISAIIGSIFTYYIVK